ncbi:S-layer homology domain-containing protein [Butyricicoccus sp. Marseille-Q5471]|uniref:S-layer homology domain-containing protein n=1 Tax=Butyricicoccus sp. Marseille-Q5471 TaxID=3039493 RepID=UPI0024BC91CC|nr:S-layer homology domain-containing protein [Butyricicoccus sp. Marseille-Q5471]
MKQFRKTTLTLITVVAMLLSSITGAFAATSEALSSAVNDTASYMYKTVANPQVGSIGGEWAVIGLARSGYTIPERYYQDYYATVEAYVKACGGVLHDKKYTEYSRLIVALSSIGKDARNVAGYDLTKALGDYDKTIWQGLNGPIWALIALDSRDYPMPVNVQAATQATRQMYVDRILDCKLADGGWSLFGGTSAASSGDGVSDPDITGMALQALAKYQDQAAVKTATNQALACMSKQQDASGGFSSWGTVNSESTVQILVALTELGVSLDDARFVKNGKTVLDNLLTFYKQGEGFLHTATGSGSNQMATEQGFYGLVAAQRAAQGKNSLYRMSDAIMVADTAAGSAAGEGLEGKHADVKSVPVSAPGVTFSDIIFSKNISAIEALASRQIINGKGDGTFAPDAGMTRAEFATITVKALGLLPKESGKFADVAAGSWYAGYVGTANTYGIVNGTSDTTFEPEGTITRQEAAAMVARAAKLCGMDNQMDDAAVRDMLAQFSDYVTSDAWARPSLAFCYQAGILDQSDLDIRPKTAIKRGEIAQMLFNMLGQAKLL